MSRNNLVLHVDKTDGSLAVALGNAVNYAAALPAGQFSMVLVVNSRAVTELTVDNQAVRPLLEKAHAAGLSVRVCNNALNAAGIEAKDLFPQCVVVPAGVVEIVNLQQDGFAYVKA